MPSTRPKLYVEKLFLSPLLLPAARSMLHSRAPPCHLITTVVLDMLMGKSKSFAMASVFQEVMPG